MANVPYIKREEDFDHRFMASTPAYGSSHTNFNNQYNQSINPAEISMQNGYNMGGTFGSQQNLSSSFSGGGGGGGSGFNDDELLSSLTNDGNHPGGMDDFSFNMQQNTNNFGHPSGIAMSQSGKDL
jgi:hypothetical protein